MYEMYGCMLLHLCNVTECKAMKCNVVKCNVMYCSVIVILLVMQCTVMSCNLCMHACVMYKDMINIYIYLYTHFCNSTYPPVFVQY